MKESAAERLSPARATELAQVLDLQAQWENLRADGIDSTTQLQSLQKAFEAYRVRLVAYTADVRGEPIPELSPTKPDRLGAWCRTVRAVLKRADLGGECPVHVVSKMHRLADRIATRVKTEPASRESVTNITTAIRELDTVIAWCDGLNGTFHHH